MRITIRGRLHVALVILQISVIFQTATILCVCNDTIIHDDDNYDYDVHDCDLIDNKAPSYFKCHNDRPSTTNDSIENKHWHRQCRMDYQQIDGNSNIKIDHRAKDRSSRDDHSSQYYNNVDASQNNDPNHGNPRCNDNYRYCPREFSQSKANGQYDDHDTLLLLVTTFDGHLFGITITIDNFKTNNIKLKQQWKIKLIDEHVFEADMNSSTFYFKGEPVTLIPSLQGGLFTLQGSEIHAMPFTTDYLLDSSFRFSENSTVVGNKITEIVKVDVTNGKILFRSNQMYPNREDNHNSADYVKSDVVFGEYEDNGDRKQQNLGLSQESKCGADENASSCHQLRQYNGNTKHADISRIQDKPSSIVFKLVSRKIKSVDINACEDKWKFKTVDISCKSTANGCKRDFTKYAETVASVDDPYNYRQKSTITAESTKRKDKQSTTLTLDKLMSMISVSVAEGSICVKTDGSTTFSAPILPQTQLPNSNSEESTNDTRSEGQQCIKFCNSIIRAWFTILKDSSSPAFTRNDNDDSVVCVEELDILKMSSSSLKNVYSNGYQKHITRVNRNYVSSNCDIDEDDVDHKSSDHNKFVEDDNIDEVIQGIDIDSNNKTSYKCSNFDKCCFVNSQSSCTNDFENIFVKLKLNRRKINKSCAYQNIDSKISSDVRAKYNAAKNNDRQKYTISDNDLDDSNKGTNDREDHNYCSGDGNEDNPANSTNNPILYIGKMLANNRTVSSNSNNDNDDNINGSCDHSYMLISDSDLIQMISRAKHRVFGESSLTYSTNKVIIAADSINSNTDVSDDDFASSQGNIMSECMPFTKLYHAHLVQQQHQHHQQCHRGGGSQHSIALAVLHNPAIAILNANQRILLVPRCCELDLYFGKDNNSNTTTNLLPSEKESLNSRDDNGSCSNFMTLSTMLDTIIMVTSSIICLAVTFLTILSAEVTLFLCSAMPAIKTNEFLIYKFESLLYFLGICLVNIWTNRSLPESQIEFIQHFAKVNFRDGRVSTKKEFQRWIYVKFVTNLWIDFPSRYESEYRHIRCLGIGGFGVVFEAINRLDHRPVAVKRIMLTNRLQYGSLQEVRFLAQLNHPHVVYYHCGWFEVPPCEWQRERDKVLINLHMNRNEDFNGCQESNTVRESNQLTQRSSYDVMSHSDVTARQSSGRNSSCLSISEKYCLKTNQLAVRNCSTRRTVNTSNKGRDEKCYSRDTQENSLDIIFDDNNTVGSGGSVSAWPNKSNASNEIDLWSSENINGSSCSSSSSDNDSDNNLNEDVLDTDDNDHDGSVGSAKFVPSPSINMLSMYSKSSFKNSMLLKEENLKLKNITRCSQLRPAKNNINTDEMDLKRSDDNKSMLNTASISDKEDYDVCNNDDYVDIGHDCSNSGSCGHHRRILHQRPNERTTYLPKEAGNHDPTQKLSKENPGYLYFCMELCQPDTLRDWLESHNTNERPFSDAVWYFIQICKGVIHIHESDLVHRDLKPSNILFSRYDSSVVKISDFGLMVRLDNCISDNGQLQHKSSRHFPDGLGKHSAKDEAASSNYGGNNNVHVVGTELYISPEQFKSPSIPINQYIDIYSLGIILFELLYPFSTNMERVLTLKCLRDLCCAKDPQKIRKHMIDNTNSKNSHLFSSSYGRREITALLNYENTHQLEWTIIKWMLSRNPLDRPTAKELLDCTTFIELAYRYLDEQRFDFTGWRRARCTSSSQTMPL
ncbi:hypothetical protein GJ496_004046 [Pomphorhynchus laevis]|nr:hypothetical protein GJ496_004046 [Pomphorhynchus laevis]